MAKRKRAKEEKFHPLDMALWQLDVAARKLKLDPDIHEKLKQGWSPEQISGRIPTDLPGKRVSHETIYQYVFKQERSAFELTAAAA